VVLGQGGAELGLHLRPVLGGAGLERLAGRRGEGAEPLQRRRQRMGLRGGLRVGHGVTSARRTGGSAHEIGVGATLTLTGACGVLAISTSRRKPWSPCARRRIARGGPVSVGLA